MTSGDLAVQVDALGAALTGLRCAVAPDEVWRVTDDDVLTACRDLSTLRARTEAAYLSLVAEVDRRRAASGARTGTGGGTSFGSTTEGLLRTAALVSAGQARRDVAAAHALHGQTTDRGAQVAPSLPGLAEQLGTGALTREHVDVAVRCLDRVPGHLLGRPADGGGSPVSAEEAGATVRDVVVQFVSEVAGSGTARDLDRASQVLLGSLDPDGGSRFDPAAYERRFLDLSTDSTGMLLGRFQLDAAAGLALRAAIDAHSAPSPTADGVRDGRPARQRRADALVAVAESARAVAAPVRGEPPRVVLHVTPEHLAASVHGDGALDGQDDCVAGGQADGRGWTGGAAWAEGVGPVARATARRMACDAVLQRVVVGPSAGPLELGRESRLASRTQRRALAVRDRGCVVPGCGAPPGACDAHHVRHWADGGATDLGNLVLLCGSHHTAVHTGTWSVVVCEDGVPEVVPPRWVDPDRRPRRLWHHLVDGAATKALGGSDVQGGPGGEGGDVGVAGSDGTDGTDGSDGTDDPDGPDGPDGTDGPDGPDGPDGLGPADRPVTALPPRRAPAHDGLGGLTVEVVLPRRPLRRVLAAGSPVGVQLASDLRGLTVPSGADLLVPHETGPAEDHLDLLLDTG